LQFLAVVNVYNDKIVDLVGPVPGRGSDSSMFPLLKLAKDPDRHLMESTGRGVCVLADGALDRSRYKYLVKPRRGALSRSDPQCCMRNPIERRFGVSKSRWKIMHHGLPFSSTQKNGLVVHVCFRLDALLQRVCTPLERVVTGEETSDEVTQVP